MKTVFDDLIPFVPSMAVAYFSGFVLGNMAYFLLRLSEWFPLVAVGYAVQFVVSISLYVLYPCRIERHEQLDSECFCGSLLMAFQRRSKPFNSCPSMHASYGLYCALSVWGFGSRTAGIVLMGWALVVALSALLTRQHYVLEVVMGAALGMGAYFFVCFLGG